MCVYPVCILCVLCVSVLWCQYLGQWSPEQVKEKVREVLYSWTVWLKDLPKVQEAYSMLKKQGTLQH